MSLDIDTQNISDTQQSNYTNALIKKQTVWWKRYFHAQAPYQWNLKFLKPGFTLEIGCGIGRNLVNLKGQGVGIDHNAESVQVVTKRSLTAFTPEEFNKSPFNIPERFDSILLAHVAEHMTQKEVVALLRQYVYLLKPKGKLIMITPQEAGFRSDSTHVEFMDFARLRDIVKELEFEIIKEYSFPFPRIFGRMFIYNEFVSVSLKSTLA